MAQLYTGQSLRVVMKDPGSMSDPEISAWFEATAEEIVALCNARHQCIRTLLALLWKRLETETGALLPGWGEVAYVPHMNLAPFGINVIGFEAGPPEGWATMYSKDA